MSGCTVQTAASAAEPAGAVGDTHREVRSEAGART